MAQVVAFRKSRSQASKIENRKVTPRRLPNKELRKREYLTPGEVARLLRTARKLGRYGAPGRDTVAARLLRSVAIG
jgi:hypothetical protein